MTKSESLKNRYKQIVWTDFVQVYTNINYSSLYCEQLREKQQARYFWGIYLCMGIPTVLSILLKMGCITNVSMVYIICAILLVISIVLKFKNKKLIYVVLCSTVIFRTTGETRQYDFHLFWSYKAIQEGREDLLAENIMNVVVFIPVGLLLSIAFKQVTWWKALLIGCCISVTIEALQFFLMRGFSELDDVMHNTVGCLIGWLMVKGSRFMVNS